MRVECQDHAFQSASPRGAHDLIYYLPVPYMKAVEDSYGKHRRSGCFFETTQTVDYLHTARTLSANCAGPIAFRSSLSQPSSMSAGPIWL